MMSKHLMACKQSEAENQNDPEYDRIILDLIRNYPGYISLKGVSFFDEEDEQIMFEPPFEDDVHSSSEYSSYYGAANTILNSQTGGNIYFYSKSSQTKVRVVYKVPKEANLKTIKIMNGYWSYIPNIINIYLVRKGNSYSETVPNSPEEGVINICEYENDMENYKEIELESLFKLVPRD